MASTFSRRDRVAVTAADVATTSASSTIRSSYRGGHRDAELGEDRARRLPRASRVGRPSERRGAPRDAVQRVRALERVAPGVPSARRRLERRRGALVVAAHLGEQRLHARHGVLRPDHEDGPRSGERLRQLDVTVAGGRCGPPPAAGARGTRSVRPASRRRTRGGVRSRPPRRRRAHATTAAVTSAGDRIWRSPICRAEGRYRSTSDAASSICAPMRQDPRRVRQPDGPHLRVLLLRRPLDRPRRALERLVPASGVVEHPEGLGGRPHRLSRHPAHLAGFDLRAVHLEAAQRSLLEPHPLAQVRVRLRDVDPVGRGLGAVHRVPEVVHPIQIAELAPAVAPDVERHQVDGGRMGERERPVRPLQGALRPAREHLVLGATRVELRQELRRLAVHVLEEVDAAVQQLARGHRVAAEADLEVEPAHAPGGLVVVAVLQRLLHRLLVRADRLVHVDLARRATRARFPSAGGWGVAGGRAG